ncbi:MAG: hypothetical protein HYZ75_17450 [Elusimicrobia bacterium]|nr:hypothetical protein [Elusimicrobiota bacterium]
MTPEAVLLLALLAKHPPERELPTEPERPPVEVYFGAELPSPFLPVLPPSAAWELPRDLKDAPTAFTGGPVATGWITAPSSLLLLTPSGSLVHELGLGRFSEEDGAVRREMRGASSADGRFAWHWQSVLRRPAGRVEKAPEPRTALVYLGSRGQILGKVEDADAPAGLPPAVISADGETLLAARREGGAWTAAALSFTGKELAAVAKAHRLEAMALTPDGRRALVVWAGLDRPLMVTILDLRSDQRLDLPADGLPNGPWSLGPDGALLAAGKPVPRVPRLP